MYPSKADQAIGQGQWGKLNNFEFVMNWAYALNRDKLKCCVCGGWLISSYPFIHRINPRLPLNKVNKVNNLISLHKKCFYAVNNPHQDDGKAQKKIIGYREKLVPLHARNNQSALMERHVRWKSHARCEAADYLSLLCHEPAGVPLEGDSGRKVE